ncbi:hypothetical protein [Psychrobacter sp. BF1]|uniref:hypothetical protein n=1 Tax=Psychrobacter sp. BF1 TaxID=2821147 RepID=UPI001C4E2563|nr:hypothetical protein [Psychrobacter sp. BF1]
MRYHGRINYVKCHEWGLNVAQGALFDLLNESSSWAKTHIIGEDVYYWVSRNKVLDELPVVYKKADTVYRNLKVLEEKCLIVYVKEGVKDLVMLTEKGKAWNAKINSDINPSNGETDKNTEINPSKFGNKSENTGKNTDINPTDKDTNTNKNTSNKNTSDRGNSGDWIDESFEGFYESYPNKKGKGQAQKTWNNVFLGKGDHKKPSNPSELFETIMNAVKTQTSEILLSEPRFRKHPSTWLDAKAWLDEVASQPTQLPVATESYKPAFNGWNDRNPDYQPPGQQSNVYHPSQSDFKEPAATSPVSDPNWHWKDPLPGMSIPQTEKYLQDNKLAGEKPNKTYQRVLIELQETV